MICVNSTKNRVKNMDYDDSSMDISVTESENYTPRHNYYTRLSAKLSNSSLPALNHKESFDNSDILNSQERERTLIVKSSKKLRLIYNKCLQNEEVLDYKKIMGWQDRNYGGSTMNSVRSPTCARPCPPNDFWNKYSKYIFLSALIGMVVIPTMNNIFQTFHQLADDVDQLKKDSKGTVMKLQNLDESVLEMKKHSYNVQSMVIDEVERLAADKTGKTDFALESTGGAIIKLLPGTENFDKPRNIFGMMLCEGSHGARAMIQPGTAPGQCWAIKGSCGGAIIKLLSPIMIESISIEHISKQMSPTGEISTAPKDFVVNGLRSQDDMQGVYLGQFQYNINGPSVQCFTVASPFPIEYLSFKVLSNHGNPDFTCVYRFRVHGVLNQSSSKN